MNVFCLKWPLYSENVVTGIVLPRIVLVVFLSQALLLPSYIGDFLYFWAVLFFITDLLHLFGAECSHCLMQPCHFVQLA